MIVPPPVEPPADESVVDTKQSKLPPGARAFFDWMVVIVVALLVAFLVRTFVIAHFVVEGESMYSTLDTGDRVFVNKLSYRLHDPNRGDVVVLHQITGASERDLIKRVIGLPGETVEVRNCTVLIDGRVLDEPYLDPEVVTPTNCGGDFVLDGVVPADHVFVMGDNRGGSQDSRVIGPISEDDLVGRAFVVFWPRSHWQWL
jgi:signal peptidase I